MRCKRSERAAGERAERLGRGEGVSVMCGLSETSKMLLAYFCVYENRIYRDSELRQQPIGARSEAAESRREGKALRNRVLRQANPQ